MKEQKKRKPRLVRKPYTKEFVVEPEHPLCGFGMEVLKEETSQIKFDPAKPECINHPEHYGGDTTYEAIKVIEAWNLGFCLGNAVKYICRAGKKGEEQEDLEKALWYVQRRIEQLKRGY